MKRFRKMLSVWLVCLLPTASVAPSAWAESGGAAESSEELSALRQDVQRLTTMVEQLTDTVRAQGRRIESLEGENTRLRAQQASGVAVPSVAQAAGVAEPAQAHRSVPKTAAAVGRAAPSGLQAFNPEIGVIADVVASLTESEEDAEGNDKISVREVELVFAHDVDPFSRFDSTITFSDFEDPAIEDAFITRWGLPFDSKAKIGRMRPKIGKASAVHRDQLDTVDEPLVVQKYLGIEGLYRTGVEASAFIPNPWENWLTYELTAGVMEGGIGEEGTLFGETRRRPSFYAHLKKFAEFSDETNVESGLTYLVGSKDEDDDYEVQALGVDLTLTHHVTPVNKLKWQSEAYLQARDETDSEFNDNPFGLYSLIDYRVSPRFGVGARFDYVEPVDNAVTNPRDADTAVSGYLTLYQSEFARWRAQYQHIEHAAGGNEERVFLQGTVAIGVHKHQLQ